MKFGTLPTLQAVVRRGNFAAAANELGLTASAVSQQMRQLEDYFGQPLFDRSGRAVKPTGFALEVVATVEGALSGLQALRDRSRPGTSGRVRLGVINSVQLSTLPAILRVAARRYPTLQIALEPQNTSEKLLESLKAGDIDAAVVVRQRAIASRKLVWNALAEEPFVLVYPRGHQGPNSVRRIVRALPWVRYNTALEGGRIASSFIRHIAPGLQPRYEVMTTDAVIAMVAEDLGFSVIPQPRRAILDALPVTLVRLGRQVPPRQILLARRAADGENRRIDALLACMREVYSQAEEV
ncbi:LysR family transcriptional regulator [Xylophilus sp.]|uniref:LysR family transcriptional regulator n=1 Tax=Xylophilus sp. TaxID=2653893 RepID=UPI0013B96C78|nr:LysR family transcriptional regulator [Xylophilus sp.]KAF1046447.1 MAG: HTH-type transcriptional regulator GltC [Xylophilus sp.]